MMEKTELRNKSIKDEGGKVQDLVVNDFSRAVAQREAAPSSILSPGIGP